MNKILFSSIILLVSVSLIINGNAESSTESLILTVPPHMIVNESYEGMITLLEPSNSEMMAVISSSNEFILKTDKTVKISTNANHGIFKITPLNEGEIVISILYDGKLLTSETKVFSKKSDAQKLKLILPSNSTVTTDMKGFVFLLDGNDSPIPSEFDRIISLTSSEKITTPINVVIKNGTSYAMFPVSVKATGEINAIATQLKSDTIHIEKSQEIIDVKIGIAPTIVLEESYTNYFIWLEKDGKPYTVKGVQKVEIQSSNTDVIRLGVSPSNHKNENTMIVSMYDGISKGRLYTGDSGIVEISASITNYGHTSTMVYVGSTQLSSNNDESNNTSVNDGEYESLEINNIQFSVYPNITNDVAYGVASLYHAEQTEEIEITLDDNGVQVSNIVEQTVLVPVKTEDVLISISSENGLKHNSSYLLDDIQFPTHSKIFEISAESIGNYTITVTGGNSYSTSSLFVTTDHNSDYKIKIVELPILSHYSQPLLMVSIVNENDELLDISELFGSSISVDVYSTNARTTSSSILFDENVGIVSGLLTGISSITISSDIFGAITQDITPSGVPVSLELFSPSMVHSGESFPIVIHEIDSKGTPLFKKDSNTVSSSGFESLANGRIVMIGEGTQNIAILSGLGGGFQKEIELFVNKLNFDLDVDNNKPRLGQSVIIKIDSPIKGITYDIDSPFPYDKIDSNTFEITPDHEINDAVITIIGKLDGFATTNKQVSVTSVNLVEIKVSATSVSGDIITPKFKLSLTDVESTFSAPYTLTIKPQSAIITMPQDHKTVTSGYKMIELSINGKIINGNTIEFYAGSDKEITAIYDRFVKITVIDGDGSGIYPYGDKVTISAPDKHIVPILVRETFDYWIGIEERQSSFVVTTENDIEITAIYKDDYSILMILIFSIVVGIFVIILRKGDSVYKYHLENVIESVTDQIKKITKFLPTKK